MSDEELLLPWAEEEAASGVEEPGARETAPVQDDILTVSEVNRLAKRRLETMNFRVQGEVSKLTTGYAYYVYFDLRDAEASLPAILTRQQLKALDFTLEEGSSVVVRGTLTLYERQGKYQIRVSDIEPFGEGDIQRRIEALKRKLHAEGLFDDARKKPLPAFPERIGLVTSPSGAAVRDVVVTLGRRFPPASVFLRGVRVQGASAVRQICSALDFFDTAWPVDVVILARGGGSLQDLEPFNSEEVARAVARMRTPVVSGIGHEPDVTVVDLVADRRASTPTGAAEAAVPDRGEVSALLVNAANRLKRREAGELKARTLRLEALKRRPLFRGPEYVLGPAKQRWERAAAALPGSPGRGLARGAQRLAVVASRPVFRRTGALLAAPKAGIGSMRDKLGQGGPRAVERHSRALEKAGARLEALSPLAVLERGYSITFNKGIRRGGPLLGRGRYRGRRRGKARARSRGSGSDREGVRVSGG